MVCATRNPPSLFFNFFARICFNQIIHCKQEYRNIFQQNSYVFYISQNSLYFNLAAFLRIKEKCLTVNWSYANRKTSVITTPKRPGAHIWPTRCWQIYPPQKMLISQMIVYGISHCTCRSPYITLADLPPSEFQFHIFQL